MVPTPLCAWQCLTSCQVLYSLPFWALDIFISYRYSWVFFWYVIKLLGNSCSSWPLLLSSVKQDRATFSSRANFNQIVDIRNLSLLFPLPYAFSLAGREQSLFPVLCELLELFSLLLGDSFPGFWQFSPTYELISTFLISKGNCCTSLEFLL